MGIAAAGLLLGAAVLPWMSIVSAAVIDGLAFPVFGVQASLWDLAGPASPVALVSLVPLVTGILLVAAALGALARGWLAAVITLVALLLFSAGTESLFGVHVVGSAFTVVAPGPGIEWAVAGLAAAAVSFRFRSRSLADLSGALRTPEALAPLGLFLAGVFLAIDAVDHASGGDLLAVFGTSGIEYLLHGLFIGGTAALVVFSLLRPSWFQGVTGSALIATAVIGLVLDGMFHAATGDATEFVGHTGAEILAHAATYYGLALLMISRFVLPRPSTT
jgi:hypothetical protein